MKLSHFSLFATALIVLFSSCHSKKAKETTEEDTDARLKIYRASVTHINDIVHTRLELHPDFSKREMKGTAYLTFEPHFYPVDSLILDAVYMRIESVGIIQNTSTEIQQVLPLGYSYDSSKLRIALNRCYSKEESYTIQIQYVAQPERVPTQGSSAITSRKGLYFINHDGKQKGKPTQLWTQGETQAASCWFPTIDAPNQKSSMELSVEVPNKFKSISNGLLMKSVPYTDSTRMDYWKQDLPHAPYLFALVLGDFAEVKDKWNAKDVHYFVEPEYEQYAKLIFGNTPEMLTFYSNLLGYDYPWDKYHQVVVRDFVSGAMENTGCVVHFDKLQHDSREHLDETYEDIIAHELFHHWFGDLITCESWSNIPLNESFATYGEYLWNEHKYGRDEADYKLMDFHGSYLGESLYKSEDLIRYHYAEQEDMFDAHSYQKGGAILHMLRKYVGDDAFFASLKLYVHKNQYRTVEVSDLRKAFEEVTGEDLNWFFNQWFLDKGHPDLTITHQYSAKDGYTIQVIQSKKTFRLSLDVDVKTEKGIIRKRVILDKDTQIIKVEGANENSYVQFDAENQLLADKVEIKSESQWKQQMNQAPLALHRFEAHSQLIGNPKLSATGKFEISKQFVEDSFWFCRLVALNGMVSDKIDIEIKKPFAIESKSLVLNEKNAMVRKAYVSLFYSVKDEETLKQMLNDSSYSVVRSSLNSLSNLNKDVAYEFADKHREDGHRKMQSMVFNVISRHSKNNEIDFFFNKIKTGNSETVELAGGALGAYTLSNQSQHTDEVLQRLEQLLASPEYATAAKQAITSMHSFYYYQIFYIQMIMGWDKQYKKSLKPKLEQAKIVFKKLEALKEK